MDYTRYKYSRNLSWEILIREGIRELPVKLIPMCRKMGIRVLRYCDVPQIVDKSESGCQAEIDGNIYILYDETVSPQRKRFTIAHELGHIIMRHTGIPDDEHEANIFASRLLMPACVLYECHAETPEQIMEMCFVSRMAAKIRAQRLSLLKSRKKFYLHPLERKVRRRFRKYIKSHRLNR